MAEPTGGPCQNPRGYMRISRIKPQRWQGKEEQAAAYAALEGESVKEQEEWRLLCEGLKVSPHPSPYTLHPTLYTLHPTPYTPPPTPCTLHPAHYTPLPTPFTV